MSNSANPLLRVAAHVVGTRFEDLPANAVDKVKTFLLDTIGVGLAGTSGTGIEALKQVAAGWGAGREATVWLTGERMPAQSAAIVNAYQIHCLEFDCVHEGAVLHPMATILSAVFAWAEREKDRGVTISGRDLVTALALGVDVSTMLGIVTNSPLKFFRPATAGGFGAAAAISRLAGFNERQLMDALGAQYAQTSGTLQPHVEGSPMLGLQVGFNARASIVGTDLARAGFRGPHDILTGQYGYFVLFENNDYPGLDTFLDQLGHSWQIENMSHKPFPSGRLTHGVVDALEKLMTKHGFVPDDIAGIVCHVPPLVHRLVGRPDIAEPEANYAKLCLRFVAGTYLARGHVDVLDFRGPEKLNDPLVHRFASLVDVRLDGNPDQNALDPQTVMVTLKTGATHEITLPHVYGHPKAPLSRQENIDKFRRCCALGIKTLPDTRVDTIIDMIDRIESLDDITMLVDRMVAP